MASDTLVRTFYEGHLYFNGRKPLPDLSGNGYLSGSFPSGITSVEGVPVSADVRILYRPEPGLPGDGVIVAQVQSAQDGTWLVDGLNHNLKYDVVGRKDGYNDVIMSNVSPALVEGLEFAGSLTALDDQVQILLGTGPYQVELVDGTPPLGVSFSAQGEFIVATGTPENLGLFTFTLRVIDSNGLSGTFVSALEVAAFDEHWNDVVALLHFDGDFVDQAGKTWEPVGVPSTTPTNPVFGIGSAEKRGGTGYLVTGHPDDFIFPDDFTIEAWILTDAGANHTMLIGYVDNANELLPLYLDSASSGRVFWKGSNAIRGLVLPVGEWFHYALTRKSGVLRAFVNGVLQGSATRNGTVGVSGGVRLLGDHASYSGWRGQLDELRITKGVARYTENFTPPTDPFPRGANG